MPLNPAGLTASLTSLFADPGDDAQVRAGWADAIRSYTTGIAPPVPSGVQDGARAALEAALAGLDAPGQAVAVLSLALVTYAASLAAGMAPPGVPPPVPIAATLAPVAATLYLDHASAAAAWATAIDAWFRTGLAGAGAPPPPWS